MTWTSPMNSLMPMSWLLTMSVSTSLRSCSNPSWLAWNVSMTLELHWQVWHWICTAHLHGNIVCWHKHVWEYCWVHDQGTHQLGISIPSRSSLLLLQSASTLSALVTSLSTAATNEHHQGGIARCWHCLSQELQACLSLHDMVCLLFQTNDSCWWCRKHTHALLALVCIGGIPLTCIHGGMCWMCLWLTNMAM